MTSFSSIIEQMVTQIMFDAEITSAGGESPKTNRIIKLNDREDTDFDLLDQLVKDAIKELGLEAEENEARELTDEQRISKLFKGNAQKAQNLLDYVTSPEDKLASMMGRAGPVGAAIASAIVVIFKSEQISDEIITLLTAPGSPLDRRLKIFVEEGMNAFFDRMEQRRRQIGKDQVILSQVNGFGNSGGLLTSNTLSEVRDDGISRIGLNEHGLGFS